MYNKHDLKEVALGAGAIGLGIGVVLGLAICDLVGAAWDEPPRRPPTFQFTPEGTVPVDKNGNQYGGGQFNPPVNSSPSWRKEPC